MTTIRMGYMGSCSLGGTSVLCTNMSASLDQKVQFFDHIVGLQDTLTIAEETGAVTKGPTAEEGGEDPVASAIQKKTYRYLPALARASISGYVTGDCDEGSVNFEAILDKAISGAEVDAVLTFWKTNARQVTISKARITSFTINLKAGDLVTFSCELTGAGYSSSITGASTAIDCTKIVNWSQCAIGGSVTSALQGFDLTITNPPVPIYTAQWTPMSGSGRGLMPQKIRLGVQEVTGVLSMIEPQDLSGTGTVQFEINGVKKLLNVVFLPPSDQGTSGPYIQTINFVGASDTSVWGTPT